jgi:hypothetical protein
MQDTAALCSLINQAVNCQLASVFGSRLDADAASPGEFHHVRSAFGFQEMHDLDAPVTRESTGDSLKLPKGSGHAAE